MVLKTRRQAAERLDDSDRCHGRSDSEASHSERGGNAHLTAIDTLTIRYTRAFRHTSIIVITESSQLGFVRRYPQHLHHTVYIPHGASGTWVGASGS